MLTDVQIFCKTPNVYVGRFVKTVGGDEYWIGFMFAPNYFDIFWYTGEVNIFSAHKQHAGCTGCVKGSISIEIFNDIYSDGVKLLGFLRMLLKREG